MKYCNRCEKPKPPRAHHCQICNKCVSCITPAAPSHQRHHHVLQPVLAESGGVYSYRSQMCVEDGPPLPYEALCKCRPILLTMALTLCCEALLFKYRVALLDSSPLTCVRSMDGELHWTSQPPLLRAVSLLREHGLSLHVIDGVLAFYDGESSLRGTRLRRRVVRFWCLISLYSVVLHGRL